MELSVINALLTFILRLGLLVTKLHKSVHMNVFSVDTVLVLHTALCIVLYWIDNYLHLDVFALNGFVERIEAWINTVGSM